MSARQKDVGGESYGLRKIAGDRRERRQEQIAKAVALESRPLTETVLKQSREKCLVLRQGDNTVANVAGRKHVELFTQAAAGTAVIADRNHRRHFANDRLAASHGK